MFFTDSKDFFNKTCGIERLSRKNEKKYAILMEQGDLEAREKIVQGYLPLVASYVKRVSDEYQSLELIYRCIQTLEKSVDEFNFQQESETFTHRLSLMLRNTCTRYIADK